MNPFTPGWGFSPQVLVGRDRIIAGYEAGFVPDAHTNRWRRTHLVGPRGSGKTVMLDMASDIAMGSGWLVVSVDAGNQESTLADRILREIRKLSQQIDPERSKLTSGSVSAFGVGAGAGWSLPDDLRWVDLRSGIETIIDSTQTGLLITIDEIQEASRDDLHTVANTLQLVTRSGRPIAIAMAGLPESAENQPTFLRRTFRPDFDVAIPDAEIQSGLRRTAALGNWEFTPQALHAATITSAGLPYLMQLVGYYSVDAASTNPDNRIALDNVNAAVPIAVRDYARSVSVELDAPIGQLRYMAAMAIDNGPSRTGQIARRLKISAQHANVIRTQLIDAGLITPAGHGRVEFVDHWMPPVMRSLGPSLGQQPPGRSGFDTTHDNYLGFER